MKVWITKYALSGGIYEATAIKEDDGNDCLSSRGAVKVIDKNGLNREAIFHGEGTDWHRTKEDAHERADMMRHKKIASLQKQIAKLKAMEF